MSISPADFTDFFRAIHGYSPFPWQRELLNQLACSNSNPWPDVLDLPTGSGKTAALDAAVFHLALCVGAPNKAALRIAFVVDRRLVVDDAYARAKKIAEKLHHAFNEATDEKGVVKEVAQRLQHLAGKNGSPLVVQRLRGGAPLEDDWARTPTQPTILCSTVDQVGSRLLFRGYGVSDRMKPIHAGLLGNRSLILLDEAHLAEPFRQTLGAIQKIGRADLDVALLSATPGGTADRPFSLSSKDWSDPMLGKRLRASKPTVLSALSIGGDVKDADKVPQAFANEARSMMEKLIDQGTTPAAVGVVVNRVALARHIFTILKSLDNNAILMTGRSRDVDRDSLARQLAPFKTGARNRRQAKPLFIVATQCLEVGVDLDLDGLVTQAASLDALRQRFGRLNRAGRLISAKGTIIALKNDISKKTNDPVYGDRIRRTWDALKEISEGNIVNFGVEDLSERLENANIEMDNLVSKKLDAPVLMPAYLDLWSHTSPRPSADPDVSLFLHGTERSAAGVSILWRSDISEEDLTDKDGTSTILKDVMRLVPPRAAETIELPLWVAQAWLSKSEGVNTDISDAPEQEKEARVLQSQRKAFRWAGYDNPDTRIVHASNLRVGDLLVVPAQYGGCDQFGWAPDTGSLVEDVADKAAKPYWGQRCAVRVTPDVDQWNRMSDVLISQDADASELVEELILTLPPKVEDDNTVDYPPPRDIRFLLEKLHHAKGQIDVFFPYAKGREGGAIFVAQQGVNCETDLNVATPTTEDESASYTSSKPVFLDDHGLRVAQFAEDFARALGLGSLAEDLCLAAKLHDAGKADPRFQAMLAGGDPWNRPDGLPLAKGGRPWSPQAWKRAELPKGWRHEALSVRMAQVHPRFTDAHDPGLVLWLIGSHHGLGRPFFGFTDPLQEKPLPCLGVSEWQMQSDMPGPQSLAFDFNGYDWPSLFEDLRRRYGIWGLAHLEAILRLADHRASEQERAL